MKRIYKYPIETTDKQTLSLPRGAIILTIQTQKGRPCLWALIDDQQRQEEQRTLIIVGTGHPIEEPVGVYQGTYQLQNGGLVFHVFDSTPDQFRSSILVPHYEVIRMQEDTEEEK